MFTLGELLTMIIEPKRVLFVPDWMERTLLNNGKSLPDILNFDTMDMTLSQQDLISLFIINDVKQGYTSVWLGGDASPCTNDPSTLPLLADPNALQCNPTSVYEDDGLMCVYSRTQYGTQAVEYLMDVVKKSSWVKTTLDHRLYNQADSAMQQTEDLLSDEEVFYKFIDLDTHVLAVVIRTDAYHQNLPEHNNTLAGILRAALLKRLCDYQKFEHVARRPLMRDHIRQINQSLI